MVFELIIHSQKQNFISVNQRASSSPGGKDAINDSCNALGDADNCQLRTQRLGKGTSEGPILHLQPQKASLLRP